jgi:hypothetical protein
MKKAHELYDCNYPADYDPIIESFGEVLIKVDDDDYQGDSRVLLKDGDKYGVLIFGFGSCSGCDRLQACSNYNEIDELIQDMHNDIHWFNSLDECKKWAEERDWELQHSWHCKETKDFVNKLLNY